MTEEESAGAGITSVLLHPFIKCISLLNFGHPIHPTIPLHLPDSEFLSVQNGYKIRLLHLKPPNDLSGNDNQDVKYTAKFDRKSLVRKSLEKRNSIRNSMSEEYWFTRWNKPLPGAGANRCSCSFRRSQKFPEETSPSLSAEKKIVPTVPNVVTQSPPTKIKNVETFVERILQETLLEAYQELYITKTIKPQVERITADNSDNGYDNLGFIPSPDEIDTSVVVKRRKPKKPAESKHNVEGNAKNSLCRHNIPKINKPFVFLLHGIGSSADVWWHIIASLLTKGFEIAAPDMLGHGYSSAPNKRNAYRFKTLLEHALAAFDNYAQRDETRKFIVIGHSFGCSLATAIARYRPSQVVQLVLISGGGPTALSPPEIGNEISVFSNLQVLISPLLFCGMKRSLFYATRGKHFQRCDTDDSIPKYVLDYIDREQHWPEGDAAFHRRILIPTLLVHGLKDTSVTLVQECEMERTIPRAFLELIPTAGHMSLLETPEQLSHMILCFVEWWAR